MGEWIIGMIIRNYLGTTIGIHSPIPGRLVYRDSKGAKSGPLGVMWGMF